MHTEIHEISFLTHAIVGYHPKLFHMRSIKVEIFNKIDIYNFQVVKDDGILCGPNEEGECWIRGPQVMLGYWHRPEQTAEVMDKEGFMRTGDIVHYDEKGNTFITDRIKELIKVNGKQVGR